MYLQLYSLLFMLATNIYMAVSFNTDNQINYIMENIIFNKANVIKTVHAVHFVNTCTYIYSYYATRTVKLN